MKKTVLGMSIILSGLLFAQNSNFSLKDEETLIYSMEKVNSKSPTVINKLLSSDTGNTSDRYESDVYSYIYKMNLSEKVGFFMMEEVYDKNNPIVQELKIKDKIILILDGNKVDRADRLVWSGYVDDDEVINRAPTVSIEADKTIVKVGGTVLLKAKAADSDGTISSYEWKNQDNTVLGTNATLNYEPKEVGTDTVTVTVMDDDGAIGSDSIQITVEEIPNTDQDDVDKVKDSLSFDDIKNSNTTQNAVISNLNLMTIENGVSILWESSEPNIIKNDGTVTRPSSSNGDKEVTLTAKLSKGSVTNVSITPITLIVKAEEALDDDTKK